MSTGKFWVHRSLFLSDLFKAEKANDTSAWIDLIGMAAYKDTVTKIRDVRVKYNRGEIAYAIDFYATRWRWSKGKVLRFFEYLEDNKMILRVNPGSTIVTIYRIVNYEKYQSNDTAHKSSNRIGNEFTKNKSNSTIERDTNNTQFNKDKNREIKYKSKIIDNNDNNESHRIQEEIFIKLLDKWNSLENNTSKVISLTKARTNTLNARLIGCQKLYSDPFEAFEAICDKITLSKYLNGKDRGGKHAEWDWLMESDERWLHILEGKYDNKEIVAKAKTPLMNKSSVKVGF